MPICVHFGEAGPRTLIAPYVWTREFAHASVTLNLLQKNASGVTFHE
jgi:hypothetical protein